MLYEVITHVPATKPRVRRTESRTKRGRSAALDDSPAERRRAMRFAFIFRVDYELGGRQTFNYATDLSPSGLYLRNIRDLEPGQQLALTLNP